MIRQAEIARKHKSDLMEDKLPLTIPPVSTATRAVDRVRERVREYPQDDGSTAVEKVNRAGSISDSDTF